MKFAVASLVVVACAVAPAFAEDPIDYRFDRVRSKVTLETQANAVRASEGTVAHGGDRVRTGWNGYALLAAPRYAANFELFASSDVRLASDTPGVLVSLERGRLKAIFDKITGDEPRMVQTPGALLAVRGTRYGVEVGSHGETSLFVFEGIVEVRSALDSQPLLVNAGERCHYSTTRRPEARPMPRGVNEEMWQRHGSSAGGGMSGDVKDSAMPREGGGEGMGGSRTRPAPGSGHHGH